MSNFDLRKYLVENKLTRASNTNVNEDYDEEEGSGYSYKYKEGNGASEEEIQGNIDHYKKNPVVWKMLSKKDFEAMAKGEAADVKNEHYPEWKKEDFVKVLEALKDINETKKMENFDLKKFLAENKLTENSKELAEYDMTKTGESIQYEFKTEEGSRVKIGADNLPGYINSRLDKAGNKGVTLTFISKVGLVPDYKITNRTDDFGRHINEEKGAPVSKEEVDKINKK